MSFNNIINFHAHIYPENIAERATQSVSDGYGIKMDYNGTLEQLIEDGKKSGVTQFAVQSVAVTLGIVFCKYCSHRIKSPYR